MKKEIENSLSRVEKHVRGRTTHFIVSDIFYRINVDRAALIANLIASTANGVTLNPQTEQFYLKRIKTKNCICLGIAIAVYYEEA